MSGLVNGSPNEACATTPVPSKKVDFLIPFVRSMIWFGNTKSPGAISSLREPTAENAMMERTPMALREAMLAREGTLVGEWEWEEPCRGKKAILAPDGREDTVIGAEG